jgi:UDP-N-acetylglucosamine diphosphorylase/glucosamine-1-phosphate N-acetyltransferase
MDGPLAVVLAAGKGTRMKSDLPKVVFPALGRPMIHYVVDALRGSRVEKQLIVVGYRGELVRQALRDRAGLEFVEQNEQRGTGHAVKVCLPRLDGHDGAVVILTGDSPLIQTATLERLLAEFDRDRPACILGTLHADDAEGLGRIVRDDEGRFVGIVEHKDASQQQRRITEVNMSTYVFDARKLAESLRELRNDNAQGEYYLTDCPGILRRAGEDVRALPVLQPCEGLSVNNVEELKVVESEMLKMGYADART